MWLFIVVSTVFVFLISSILGPNLRSFARDEANSGLNYYIKFLIAYVLVSIENRRKKRNNGKISRRDLWKAILTDEFDTKLEQPQQLSSENV